MVSIRGFREHLREQKTRVNRASHYRILTRFLSLHYRWLQEEEEKVPILESQAEKRNLEEYDRDFLASFRAQSPGGRENGGCVERK